MWGALCPAGVVGAAGQGGVSPTSSGEGGGVIGGGLPHQLRGRWRCDGRGLPHQLRARWQCDGWVSLTSSWEGGGVMGGGAGEGAEPRVGFGTGGAPCAEGDAHWKVGVSGLRSRPSWPLCRPLNVPGSFPCQASACALALPLPGAGTTCPPAVPWAAPSRPPTSAQRPPALWDLPNSVISHLPPARVCTRQRPHCPQSIGHRLQSSPRWLLSLCTHLAVDR